MKFQSRTVVCNESGLTQEQALEGLYEAYGDVRVASIKRRGDSWVATIMEKLAEFPPKKKEEGGDEGGEPAPDMPEDEGPPSDEGDEEGGDEGPPMGDGEGGDEGGDKKEKGGEHEVLNLLHQIFQGLLDSGIVQPPMHDKMVPGNEPGPQGPPAPPAGGPQPMQPGKMPSKLKPGEVLPTQTPVGAPAFSSVQHEANACMKCGGQAMPDGSCPACETMGGHVPTPPAVPGTQPGPAPIHPMVGKVATFSVQSDKTNMRPSEAQANLDAEFGKHGYKVKELQYDETDGVYRALLSIR